ncbi:hypothetical protein BJY01DRAFT_214510 [Aspergillus pseudoustus]|uniref:Cytochrome P450 n=1 Tax=Aspergillus pseudoustus TaxID=1810923 RepID=A0ABR4JYE6_9EURO
MLTNYDLFEIWTISTLRLTFSLAMFSAALLWKATKYTRYQRMCHARGVFLRRPLVLREIWHQELG